MEYTEQMRKALKALPKSKYSFRYAIVKYPSHLAIRVYEQDFHRYNEAERGYMFQHLLLMKSTLEAHGAKVTLEGIDNQGKLGGKIKL